MNILTQASHEPTESQFEIRRRRLVFRSWNRGTQESDLILGSFAEASLADFDRNQLDRFEALLDCSDPDLFDWMFGAAAPPAQHDNDVMHCLREFCASPNRMAQRNAPRA